MANPYNTVHTHKPTPHANGASCLDRLFVKQPVEHLASGQSLFFEGDDAKHVFQVVEGTLRVFRIISGGRRVITGFLDAGDIVGVSLRGRYLYSAEAITPSVVKRLARRQFDAAVASDEGLRPVIFARVCDEMAAAQDQMVLLSSKSAEERLCTFLVKYLRRNTVPGCTIIELPMTRLDIADYLGLTIETVSRTVTKLANKGILGFENPGLRHTIRIERPGMLAQLTGDGDDHEDLPGDLLALREPRRH
ncbi:cyclic nucleotide-binding domain-containing protein [Neorhizobium sp. Rsf11]|uniref:Cyclic nucleotide-binding domain-containing protein n=3 Tax=Rhizobium/Agrobacterium group TaxID=227290 RepID=A0ABV0MDK3_9HYPH|nr:cyclic nucleotide-binding domain-containing protein [Neorhizobium petrolearium]MCC2614374.1 helix-turn-helix domain-containing protein [Neorhizobium petrolearium]WGI72546.1 helix-turn-helix domain-containing protein [Neorhizobium petrolearium]